MSRYLVFCLAVLLFYGCKDDDPVSPDRGRTFLHILNAAEVDTFDVTFDYFNADDVVIDKFHWKRNFPQSGYADMEAGGTPDDFGNGKLFLAVSRQPFANLPPDTLMEPKEMILERDDYATICLADSFGQIIHLTFDDDYTLPADTSLLIRFINLSSALPTSDLRTQSGSLNITNVAFMDKSPFTVMPSGVHVFEARDSSGSVTSTQNLYLGGGAYTFYVSGSSMSLDYFKH